MSDEQTPSAESSTPVAMYAVHSTVRARHTRTLRASSGMTNRHRFKQHIMSDQRRLIRNRPILITEEQLQAHLDEFKKKQAVGILEVRTMDGRILNLDTMQPSMALPAPPLPHPLPDSADRDLKVGYTLPKHEGDKPLTEGEVEDVLSEMANSDDIPPPPSLDEPGEADYSPTTSSSSKKKKR